MYFHITWYKCFPHWDDVQWPWPGSITQRSRSHKTFKGQEYTCSCPSYNLPMHWSFGRGYSPPFVCLHLVKMVQKSLLRPCRFKMFYWWIFTVCSVFERNDFDDGVEGKMVGKKLYVLLSEKADTTILYSLLVFDDGAEKLVWSPVYIESSTCVFITI